MERGESAAPQEAGAFDLQTTTSERAVEYFAEIASDLKADDPEVREQGQVLVDEFERQRGKLFEEDVPKAMELLEMQGRHPNPDCRHSAALSITRLVEVAPEKGLRLALELLTDPDGDVALTADESLAVNEFEYSQPVIDARTVKNLLYLARDLVAQERRVDKEA